MAMGLIGVGAEVVLAIMGNVIDGLDANSNCGGKG